jgi:membrane protein DedA with SNARE-associated domain
VKKLIGAFFSIPVAWCVGAIFLLTGAETALLIGFLVPGEVAAILGGVVASRGRVPLAAVTSAAIAGAACGDTIGYFLGRRARFFERRRRRKGWSRARAFLRKGGVAVLLGRFTPFLRTLMPSAAGAAKMPYRTFLPWNLAAVVLWGASSTLIGYWGGRSAETIVHRAGLAGAAILVLVLIVLYVLWAGFSRSRGAAAAAARRARR